MRCEFAPPSEGVAGFSWRGSFSMESGPELGASWAPWPGSEDGYIEAEEAWALVTASCGGTAGPGARFDVLTPH